MKPQYVALLPDMLLFELFNLNFKRLVIAILVGQLAVVGLFHPPPLVIAVQSQLNLLLMALFRLFSQLFFKFLHANK